MTVVAASREVTYEPIEATEGLLSTVYNVEICAVGIEYPLASGPATFTPEDLQEAVASQGDPAIHSPRVWLGHPDDDRFHRGRATHAGSAEPALGKVIDLRVEDEGMTLVGDIAGVPTWLAKILASAYPNRSIEGWHGGTTTVTGREWSLIITDLALLGVVWPGVTTLDDLEALYSEDGPDKVEIIEEEPMSAKIAAAVSPQAITAQVNIEDVRRAFQAKLGEMELSPWSWVRAMQLDPNELIVDNDEGDLYRVPFSINGEEIEFDEAQKVKIEYVNASQRKDPDARKLLVNMLTDGHKVAASWDQRSESRPESNNQEDRGMTPDQVRLLRAKLGLSEEQLPDDATQEQITAALQPEGQGGSPSAPAVQPVEPPAQPGVQPGNDPGTGTPSPDQVPAQPDPNNPNQPPPAPPPQQQQPAVAASTGQGGDDDYVRVSKDAWAQVQANAAAGAHAAAQSENQRRDSIVAQAVRDGRISPAQRPHFRSMFDRDPQGTDTLLTASVDKGGLMPGTIPVEARGVDQSAESMQAEASAYPSEWLPELSGDAAPPITVEG